MAMYNVSHASIRKFHIATGTENPQDSTNYGPKIFYVFSENYCYIYSACFAGHGQEGSIGHWGTP